MTDLIEATPEVFKQEFEMLQRERQITDNFYEFLVTIPPERTDLKAAVLGLLPTTPEHILDREKKEKLKKLDPDAYREVVELHKTFLDSRISKNKAS